MHMTRRQHYVPAFYLSQWANLKGQITCHDLSKSAMFACNPANVLVQSYFYEEDPAAPDSRLAGCEPAPSPAGDRREGRDGRGRTGNQEIAMTYDHAPFLSPDTETDDEPHASSPTAHLLDELALYGYRPSQDEPDPRPLPENDTVPCATLRWSAQREAMRSAPRGEPPCSSTMSGCLAWTRSSADQMRW